MKYVQVIFFLGLIALGVFVGSYISLGGGNGALLGGILGVLLYCLINWFGSRWSGSRGKSGFLPDSQEAIENTAGLNSAQQALLEEQSYLKQRPGNSF